MLSNKLVVAALGVACIAAAAGGGYLASRQNTSDALAAAPAPATVPSAATPDRPARGMTRMLMMMPSGVD